MIVNVSFNNTRYFVKTLLAKIWSIAVAFVLVTLVGYKIRGRNPF